MIAGASGRTALMLTRCPYVNEGVKVYIISVGKIRTKFGGSDVFLFCLFAQIKS